VVDFGLPLDLPPQPRRWGAIPFADRSALWTIKRLDHGNASLVSSIPPLSRGVVGDIAGPALLKFPRQQGTYLVSSIPPLSVHHSCSISIVMDLYEVAMGH
jgi:hypothetical protein